MAMFLQVSISTDDTGPEAAIVHIVKMDEKDTPLGIQYRIIEAIETLYAYDNVLEYTIKVLDEEPDAPLNEGG